MKKILFIILQKLKNKVKWIVNLLYDIILHKF